MSGGERKVPVALVDALTMLTSAGKLMGALELAVLALPKEEHREPLGELVQTIQSLVTDAERLVMDGCAETGKARAA